MFLRHEDLLASFNSLKSADEKRFHLSDLRTEKPKAKPAAHAFPSASDVINYGEAEDDDDHDDAEDEDDVIEAEAPAQSDDDVMSYIHAMARKGDERDAAGGKLVVVVDDDAHAPEASAATNSNATVVRVKETETVSEMEGDVFRPIMAAGE